MQYFPLLVIFSETRKGLCFFGIKEKMSSRSRSRQSQTRESRSKQELDYEELRRVVVDALHYLHNMNHFVQHMVTGEEAIVSAISKNMRQRLSRPAAFATLQLLMRLSDFAEEREKANQEMRSPVLPRPDSDIDYTLRRIWAGWCESLQTYKDKQADWQPPGWDPLKELSRTLSLLISHVWAKHFLVKDM